MRHKFRTHHNFVIKNVKSNSVRGMLATHETITTKRQTLLHYNALFKCVSLIYGNVDCPSLIYQASSYEVHIMVSDNLVLHLTVLDCFKIMCTWSKLFDDHLCKSEKLKEKKLVGEHETYRKENVTMYVICFF